MKKIAAAGKIAIWRIGVEHQPEESPVAEVPGESSKQREQRLGMAIGDRTVGYLSRAHQAGRQTAV